MFERLAPAPEQLLGVTDDRLGFLPATKPSSCDIALCITMVLNPRAAYLSNTLLPGLAICHSANTMSISTPKTICPVIDLILPQSAATSTDRPRPEVTS